MLPVRLYLLKQFIQLYDFLDLEAVVDNAEEEEELDEEEFGKPIARIGKRIEMADGPSIEPSTPITPIKRPIKSAPLSPRKMHAGCQLYSKNPARLPARATAITATW